MISFAFSGVLSAQTLLHRYSFASDASDSVGTANGHIVAPNGGSPATISNGLNLPGSGGPFGASGYVSLPNGILTNTASLTLECWFTQNSGNTWATPWDFGNNGNQNFALIPYPGNNGNNMEVAFTPNGNERDLQTATAFPNGIEEYVTVTFNSATLVADIYTNATLDAAVTLPNSTYTPGLIGGSLGTTENMLGNDVYGDPQFNGTIYEFRIWNGVVSQRYLAASAIAGPGVLITNLHPTGMQLTAGSGVVLTGTEQAVATVELSQTGTNQFLATSDATNWVSSNPGVLTVNGNGFISGVGLGTATVSATINGVTATSGNIIVTPQILQHRYSFVSDATDSVGGANGTLVPPTTGNPATISNGLVLPGNT
ncbi:MAG TPA: LamG-like jellyroll fold domain-containing protein, partial [Verrucomicrobiae bacterium]|nr:LamG-like jellyroll fold domain-containing protein [Verrucomicrobiae bacterium]